MTGCRTVEGPEGAAAAYAKALRENRLDDAYALTTQELRATVTAEAFKERYAAELGRNERAAAILAALPKLCARSMELEVRREGGRWLVAERPPDQGPREALERFLDAADRGDFGAVHLMLAGAWRARYTPELLERDFAAEPGARGRLIRARAALNGEVVWAGEEAQWPLGGTRAVRLVPEAGAYKVAALE